MSMDIARQVAALRRRRGWTQEVLAERSGLSVRTIRNLELGRVQYPRQSSIDLLGQALGVQGEREWSSGQQADRAAAPWRGPRPPNDPVVGHRTELDQLATTVRGNRLTTLVGPGGVGKTRLALNIAAEIAGLFRHGVAVVELGDIPPERPGSGDQAAAVMQRVRHRLGGIPAPDSPPDPGGDSEGRTDLLLILDNAEHIPASVTAAVRDLLGVLPAARILVTARRRLTERLGANREIRPLPVQAPPGQDLSRAPAVELLLRHVGADSRAAADLLEQLPLVAELCRRLGGLPRHLEFAAERMRTIPIRMMLACGPTVEMLWSDDHALLCHQKSAAAGIRWSMDLLSTDHHRLLRHLATLPRCGFSLEDSLAQYAPSSAAAAASPLMLLSDLLEMSLILADPDDHTCYRLAPYVAQVAEQEQPETGDEPARGPAVDARPAGP
jgi:predicted ATPase/transcriptional regulator with XRE-family HTH domain